MTGDVAEGNLRFANSVASFADGIGHPKRPIDASKGRAPGHDAVDQLLIDLDEMEKWWIEIDDIGHGSVHRTVIDGVDQANRGVFRIL